ncbi:MAG: response regulator [Myxococcota bacterium]|jgi:DNA-binding response OmpR family regulator|nr:response regulator [Myxococcota bacterium]
MSQEHTSSSSSLLAAPFRLLIVENEANELKALIIGLRMEGIEATGAPNAQTALSMLKERPYDIVLTDLMMPQMSGMELARQIRKEYPDVTTIMMSGFSLSTLQLSRHDCGIVGFIRKPFRIDELIAYIHAKLNADPTCEMPLPKERFDLP